MIETAEILKSFGEFFFFLFIVAGPLTAKYIKGRYERRNFTKRKLNIAGLVSERLTEMRIKYNVDRISIIEFSNGDKSVSGFPFLFTTITYEKVAGNISHQQQFVNKVPASWYIDFNSPFTDPEIGYGMFDDTGAVKIQGKDSFNIETAKILLGNGVKTNWTFKLSKNISHGLVVFSSIDSHRVFTEDEIISILGDCKYIETLFKQRPQ